MKKTVYSIAILFCMHYYTFAQMGIGTTTPQAQLDVTGGNVRFSDYGVGTITGTAMYMLGVESDGDIIETPINRGLQYYTWNITNTTQPDIYNKRSLGVSTSQGLLNGDLNSAELIALAPDTDGFIVHYIGTIRVKNTGNFTFNARTNDGSRIYIDGTLVLENWTDNPPPLTTLSSTVTLVEGEHKIEFWYYENIDSTFMEFTWGANPDSYAVGSVINANQFFVK